MSIEKALIEVGFAAVLIGFLALLLIGTFHPVWIIIGLIVMGIGWVLDEN